MRVTKWILTVVSVMIVMLCFGCDDKPEYYHPYGEGVDPDTVTTVTVATYATSDNSHSPFDTAIVTTTVSETTTTTALVIPAGYKRCSDCGGVRVVCEVCNGTDKRKAEGYDPDSDVYNRYYEDCMICSFEDPGYYYCETCKNKLIVPE